MKKKKAYITPEVRMIFVETQGVMADFVSPGSKDKTGNPNPGATEIPSGGSSSTLDPSKFNSGSLWDYDD